MGFQRSFSVIDLIQERRGKKTEGQTLLDQGPKQAEIPNMLDVLKDIGKVKLRPAKRWAPCSSDFYITEDGHNFVLLTENLTNFQLKQIFLTSCVLSSRPEESQAKPSVATDAASLIANALKRKFAHRYRHNSNEDKEFDFPASELKPFCSEFPKTNKKVEIPLVRATRILHYSLLGIPILGLIIFQLHCMIVQQQQQRCVSGLSVAYLSLSSR